jgi:hypothetical protein
MFIMADYEMEEVGLAIPVGTCLFMAIGVAATFAEDVLSLRAFVCVKSVVVFD